jgi:hypothetical protein
MPGQIIQTQNVIVGNGLPFYQPYNPTTPPTLPPDTLAFVDPASANIFATTPSPTWPSPWVPMGATEAGLSYEVQRTTADQTIEEQSTPVAVYTTAGQVQVVLSLAEDTFETMKLAYGGGTITTTAAATGTVGTRTFTLGEGIDIVSIGFEAKGAKGLWRRVLIPQVVATGNVQTPYRRAANNRVYPVTFRMISPMSSVVTKEYNAPALP